MKKLVFGMWVLVLFLIPISVCAASDGSLGECERPTKPIVPNAATAEEWMMKRAIENVREYNKDMKQYIECAKKHLNSCVLEANELNEELKRSLAVYRDMNQKYKGK
jgi:hypothetical protein